MSFIQQPAYIITVLLLLVFFSEWLGTKKFFKLLGPALIVIIAAAILANLKLIPSSSNTPAVYNNIFKYAAPLGIFFLLLDVKLKDLKLAGLPMMLMFFLGSFATVAAVMISYHFIAPQNHQIHKAFAVAGMFTGTYIGGSANLNAIALEYGVNKDGTLFAAINAVDNILSTIWILLTILLPPILQKIFPRKRSVPPEMEGLSDEQLRLIMMEENTRINLMDMSLLLVLGFGSLSFAFLLSEWIPQIPSILTLTSIALIFAQISFVQRLKGSRVIGLLLIMLFLAVIGAFCDIEALIKNGNTAITLLIWDVCIVFGHGLIIFTIGGLLKQDWDIIGVASNANVGGATSAPVCATSLGRKDLQLPGLLAGSVGNAIGTYLGILVAQLLM